MRTVRFGGTLGTRYEPADLTVRAGDVVQWVGDFAAHPLQYRLSATEPFGPEYLGPLPLRRTLSAAGDRIEYVCAIHGAQGMRGVVTAVAAPSRPLTRPPLLSLRTVPRDPVAGRSVTFVASYVANTGDLRYTRFRWDLDGDGRVSTAGGVDQITTVPRVTTTYATAGRRTVSVQATTDQPGAAGATSSKITFVVATSADVDPPDLRVVRLEPSTVSALVRSGLTATVRASEVARARVELFDGDRLLAGADTRLTSRSVAVRLALDTQAANRLRSRRNLFLLLRVVARDDAGNRSTLRKTFIVR